MLAYAVRAIPLAGLGCCLDNSLRASSPIPADLTPKPLSRLQPGIVLGQHRAFGYSDLVSLALPRLASGDIESLPDFSRRYASMFKLAILANVVAQPLGDQTNYLLEKLGVGFAMEINGKLMIVTNETANQLGAKLGRIDRAVLSGNEDCLVDVVQIARTDRVILFDAKTNMLVGEEHQSRMVRHFIWASPSSGSLGILVWQLRDETVERYALDSTAMQLLPSGFQEDRRIHVSKGNFLSAKIPKPDRFALESLPQGTPVPFSERMKLVAGMRTMTPGDLDHLLVGASESLAMLQVPAVAKKP